MGHHSLKSLVIFLVCLVLGSCAIDSNEDGYIIVTEVSAEVDKYNPFAENNIVNRAAAECPDDSSLPICTPGEALPICTPGARNTTGSTTEGTTALPRAFLRKLIQAGYRVVPPAKYGGPPQQSPGLAGLRNFPAAGAGQARPIVYPAQPSWGQMPMGYPNFRPRFQAPPPMMNRYPGAPMPAMYPAQPAMFPAAAGPQMRSYQQAPMPYQGGMQQMYPQQQMMPQQRSYGMSGGYPRAFKREVPKQPDPLKQAFLGPDAYHHNGNHLPQQQPHMMYK